MGPKRPHAPPSHSVWYWNQGTPRLFCSLASCSASASDGARGCCSLYVSLQVVHHQFRWTESVMMTGCLARVASTLPLGLSRCVHVHAPSSVVPPTERKKNARRVPCRFVVDLRVRALVALVLECRAELSLRRS